MGMLRLVGDVLFCVCVCVVFFFSIVFDSICFSIFFVIHVDVFFLTSTSTTLLSRGLLFFFFAGVWCVVGLAIPPLIPFFFFSVCICFDRFFFTSIVFLFYRFPSLSIVLLSLSIVFLSLLSLFSLFSSNSFLLS